MWKIKEQIKERKLKDPVGGKEDESKREIKVEEKRGRKHTEWKKENYWKILSERRGREEGRDRGEISKEEEQEGDIGEGE